MSSFCSIHLSFLAHSVVECVFVLRLSSDRHFLVGLAAPSVFVSSYLFLCGLPHVLLLRVHPPLRMSIQIGRIAMFSSPLHTLMALWRVILTL